MILKFTPTVINSPIFTYNHVSIILLITRYLILNPSQTELFTSDRTSYLKGGGVSSNMINIFILTTKMYFIFSMFNINL